MREQRKRSDAHVCLPVSQKSTKIRFSSLIAEFLRQLITAVLVYCMVFTGMPPLEAKVRWERSGLEPSKAIRPATSGGVTDLSTQSLRGLNHARSAKMVNAPAQPHSASQSRNSSAPMTAALRQPAVAMLGTLNGLRSAPSSASVALPQLFKMTAFIDGGNGNGGLVAIFGSQQFVRTTGAPNYYSNSFDLPSWVTSPFELHIQNGDGAGGHRISSGTVVINGTQIVAPSDLSQDVASIDRSVSLSGHNTLQVTLASIPGSYIILTILGQPIPVANAGPNQTVFVGTMVTLDGSASTDADGDLLTYQWSTVTEPAGSTASLSDPTSVRPTIKIDKPGDYVLELVVSDGTFSSSPSQVTISTKNSPPVAIAGRDQKVQVGVPTQLDGSSSYDVDGNPLTYRWTLLVPPASSASLDNPSAVRPKFTPDVLDDYYATLVVNDGKVDSQPSTVKITSADVAPVANPGPAQSGTVGQTITLDGTHSYDSDTHQVTYQWSFTSKPANSTTTLSSPTSAQPTFVLDKPGHYAIQLVVNDGFISSTPAVTTVDTVNSPPVANAGPNQELHAGTTVQLDGSRTTDVDGDQLTYQWSFVSWPGQSQQQPAPMLSDPTLVEPTFVAPHAGTYIVQLHVDDGQGGGTAPSAYATVTITSDDIPPIANPGAPQKVIVGRTVNLDGHNSTDVDGDQITFRWSLLSVPNGSNASLSNPTSVTPSFVPDELGDYVVQLIVNDGIVDSQPSTVTITSGDTPPIANAGSAKTVQLGATVRLDGSASFDVDGHTLTYHWSLTAPAGSDASLVSADTPTPSFTADVMGNYVAQLIVNDGFINSVPATVVISTINSAPVADVGAGQKIPTGTTVHLDGTASTDADGDPLTYRWAIIVKPVGSTATLSDPTAPNPTYVIDLEGTYVVQLIVNDGTVDSAPATVMVQVENPNRAPVVNAGPDQTITLPIDTVTLNGTVNDDGKPVGVPLKITWTQVSGPAPVTFSDATSAATQATFTAVGDYVLRLTGDDSLLSSSDDVTVSVKARPNDPPVVNAGPDQTVPIPTHLQLQGSVTDDGRPVGGVLISTWTQTSGPSQAVFADVHDPHTVVTLNAEGVYKFQLTADDSELQSSASVTITGVQAKPPIVDAGPNRALTLPTTTLTLIGSVTASGGTPGPITAQWSQLSGPISAVFDNPANPSTQVTLGAAGTYVLRLTGTQAGLSNSSDVLIQVFPAAGGGNQAPYVDAGPDQNVIMPKGVTLKGTVIDDGLPTGTVNTLWEKISGPGNVTFADATSVTTTASFSAPGNYTLQLSASDSELISRARLQVLVGQLLGSRTNKGTDFWIMFMRGAPPTPRVLISSEVDTTGTIAVPGTGFSQDFSVAANSVVTITLPATAQAATSTTNGIDNNGIHITAKKEVAVYGLAYYQAQTDGFMALPTPVLGTEYIVPSYPAEGVYGGAVNSELGLVAAYDSTTVTITPKSEASYRPANVPFSFVLHKGRTFQLGSGSGDLTGSTITADKPIAVFSGHECAFVPTTATYYCNHMVEEVPPPELWGQHFVTMPFATRANGDVFRILAAKDQTHYTVNGGAESTLNSGEFQQLMLTTPSTISADQPILVTQFSTSHYFDGDANADPFMIIVPPYEQFGSSYVVATPPRVTTPPAPPAFPINYINIIVPQEGKDWVTLDGSPVAASAFTSIQSSGYAGAQIPVSIGTHRINGSTPLGVFVYGYGPDDGYGYTGGIHLGAPSGLSVALQSKTATQTLGTQHCVMASATDSSGSPLGGIGIDFTVTGVNPGGGHVDTDANGQAQFCYQGSVTGNDSIVAASGGSNDSATITWINDGQNQPPYVNAGPAQNITLPASATLVGFVADDGLPSASTLTMNWTQVSGPGSVTFANPTSAVTQATFSTAGTYTLRLTATDSAFSANSDVTITVAATANNQPPIANAGPNHTLEFTDHPDGIFTIHGSATDDGQPAGSKLSYTWSIVSGSFGYIMQGSEPDAKIRISQPSRVDTYVLRLTVDDSKATSSSDVTLTTSPANQPPSINMGATRTAGLPNANSITLTPSVVDDGKPVGGTLTYQWDQVAGPAAAIFSSPNQLSTQVTFTVAGRYTVRLTANDSELSSSGNLDIVVSDNQAPVISIPAVAPVSLPATAALNATVTDDGLPTGSSVALQWSEVSGPGTVTFSAPTQAATQATFSAAGTYTLQLAANDSLLTGTATVSVQVNPANQAPVVSAGPDQSLSLPNQTLTLNGSVKDDGLPTGAAVTLQWTEVSGPASVTFSAPTQAVTQATFTTDGTYLLRLSASDTLLTGTSDVNITVYPAPQNLPPVVSAGASRVLTLPSATTTLSGTASDDGLPTGSHLTYSWTQISGSALASFTNTNTLTPSVTFNAAGTYVFGLTVSDSQLSSAATTSVIVNPQPNQPPNVSIDSPTGSFFAPATITFTGHVTDDGLPQGAALSSQWAQISGPQPVTFSTPNQPATQISFPVAGQYVVQLSGSDTQYVRSLSFTITIAPANAPPSITQLFPEVTLSASTNSVTVPLDPAVTDDGKPNGTLAYSWTVLQSPAPVQFSAPNQRVTDATFTAPGLYELVLTANDSQLSSSAIMYVNVYPALPPGPVVEIGGPLDGTVITKPTDVVGAVTADASTNPFALYWGLEYSLNNADGSASQIWRGFASGSGIVNHARLGTFDPTLLPNGNYTIRLSAQDSNGLKSFVTSTVVVAGNMKVGAFTISFTDMTVPLPGLPIQIVRTYDSRYSMGATIDDRYRRNDDFGYGWNLDIRSVRLEKNRPLGKNWQEVVLPPNGLAPSVSCIDPTNDRIVTVTFPDGKQYRFQAGASPECHVGAIVAPSIVFTELAGSPGTAGASLVPVGGSDAFLDGPVPGTVNLVDANTNAFNPTVFQLTTAEGYVYVIDQTVGVTHMTDPAGNTLTINSNGITSSTGQSVIFTREPTHNRITQISDQNGRVLHYYYYDFLNTLTSFTDAAGNVTNYGYIGGYTFFDLLSTISDPRGGTFQPVQNGYTNGRLTSSTDGAGNTISYNHDIANHHETITDRNGKSTLYEYDDDGNIIRVTDPLGHVTSSTYDENDNKLSETDALGKTTTYTYDGNGNRTSQTDPLGHTTTYTYNARHQLTSIKDANPGSQQGTTTNLYDPQTGNLQSTTDAEGLTASYTYWPNGQVQTTTVDGLQTASFEYDGRGNVKKQTDALLNVTSYAYTYNADGTSRKTQTVTRTNNGSLESLVTTYDYDANDRLKKTTYPDNTSTSTVYNAIGKQADVFDALNRKTHYDYDNDGRVSKVTYPDKSFEQTTYDLNGNRKTFTDRAGHITTYDYDELNRLTKTHFADGSFTETVYDAAGRVSDSYDQLRNKTHYDYDDAGRRTAVTDALGKITTFAYDAAGNQTSVTDANQHTTTYVYDKLGRRTQVIHPDPAQSTDVTHYDSQGRVDYKIDQAGKRTDYGYDPDGRLISVTQHLSGSPDLVTSYGYDEVGNRISQTDASQHTTSYTYDQLGRRKTRKLPLNQTESYTYDFVGNLKTKTDFNNHTTTYGYDPNNNWLTSKTVASFFSTGSCAGGACGATSIGFTYTATGKRKTMTDATGATTYNYDPNTDRLLSKVTPFGTLTYSYDNAGNLKSIASSNANGASMAYTYDADNRLQTVTDPSGVTNYGYDDAGNLQSFAYPNGVVHGYTYDALNRLTNLALCTASASPCDATTANRLNNYAYTLWPAGNRKSVTELNGRTVTYGYDDLYRLTSETIASDPAGNNGAVGYTYDNVGNRQQITSTLAAIPAGQMFYDNNDRLTTDQYDNNGNTTVNASTTNVYDFENHLVQHGAVTIAYDGDGNRVSETTGAGTTQYLVDTVNPTGYAQVVDELQSGLVTKTYSYGLERISQNWHMSPGNWQLSFYGYDGHGSVRFLTDSAGTITDTYDYDAFGNLIASTESTPNNYRFAGEQFDPALGVYYNRARYLDVRSGRFWSMDAYEGEAREPLSLHKYVYVGAGPINAIDPSGNDFDLSSLQAAGAAFTTLAATTLITFQNVAGAVYLNLYRVPELIETANAGLITLAGAFEALRFLGKNVLDYTEGYSRGPVIRGDQFEEAAGANLSRTFPAIDYFGRENGVAIQIRSTTQTSSPEALLAVVRKGVNRVNDISAPLRGYDRWGAPVEIRPSDIKTKGVLIGIPAKPLPWFETFLKQVQQVSESEKVAITIQFVEGLEGETLEK